MTTPVLWKLYKKQLEALDLVENNKFTLLVGQGRASKTAFSIYYLFKRALKYPRTSHVIFRNTLSSAVDGIWKQTIPEIIEHFFPVLPSHPKFIVNQSSHSISFPNGSRILLRGLDTEDRATKILSQQFATVVFDESQTIAYTYFSLLLTRLPQPKDAEYDVKIICTANYAPKSHWTKIFFVDNLNPESKSPHNQRSNYIKFQTEDNYSIDAKEYIDTLSNAGDRRSRLMCAGNDFFDEIEGALWTISDIKRTEARPIKEYEEIVLAYDPAVSNTKSSDEHGICIAGRLNDEYHILECFEEKQDINEFTKKICKLYHSYNCARLIYEKNQGGDFIPALISTHDKSVYCESVHAKKGKLLRAEPVASLYKNGVVYHTQNFQTLEDQMVCYTGTGDSPNSLDSLVYAVKFLNENVSFVNPNHI